MGSLGRGFFLFQKTALLLASLLLMLPGCREVENLLDLFAGQPEQNAPSDTTPQSNAPVPAGTYFYCITNIGHTMVAFDVQRERVLTETRRVLELDPIGPWFVGQAGYYLSRVDGSGAGANALIRFSPRTLTEQKRLNFSGNSNPTDLLPLPGGHAYVALRGSTFDNWATNGLAVVDLSRMTQTAFLNFNDASIFSDLGGIATDDPTSLVGLTYHASCNGGAECVYALLNNWNGAAREGWLLMLRPQGSSAPLLLDAIPLGRNPQAPMLLDAPRKRLWVVNNGGYVHYGSSGQAGSIQVLDTDAFADGQSGNETLATLQPATSCTPPPNPDPGCDPTGIYAVGSDEAWITTYPDDVFRIAALDTLALEPFSSSLPRFTGPLFVSSNSHFVGMGGYAQARLGRISDRTLLGSHDLQAGNGPVQCAQFTQS